MNNKYKIAFIGMLSFLFVAACDSASSDAKKVEVKKVSTPAASPSAEKAENKSTQMKSNSEFEEGKHYVEIFPQMQTDASPGKVEVVELMWLGCPHCYHLEPLMLEYKKNHPEYVEFKQVPAMLNPSWAADANIFYIAELLDPTGEKNLVNKIFQSIHDQKRRLKSPDSVVRFFEQQGFTAEQVNGVKNSMVFQAKLLRAQEIGAASQAQSVPTLIINGKYRTSPYMAGGNDKVLKIINMLTARENK